jgi:tetratricopeptide (TPR) repeat protein
MKKFFLSVVMLAAIATATNAQNALKLPSLSPTAKISQDFSVSNIEISYSRPSMRGRKVMGDMVAYGKPWRTGANAPTKIKTGEDLEFAGYRVKAGEYLIYTIPDKDKWEVVMSSATGSWTADGFPREFDVARFKIKPSVTNEDCQTFSIQIKDITYNTCKIEILWERTKLVIPVTANNGNTIADNIDKAINNPPALPYFQAATYYYESNQKLDLARTYVNKALDQSPKAYYMWYLKARIEKKLGNNEEALAAAKKSIELTKNTPNELEYKRNNDKIINEINRQKRSSQYTD